METEQWLENYRNQVAGVRQASEQVRDTMAGTSVTVSSPDRAVTVTVGANGSLLDLKFGSEVGSHSLAQLSGVVMHTVSTAQRMVADRVMAALEPFGASAGPATELIASFRPDDAADDEDTDDAMLDEPVAEPEPAPPVLAPPVSAPVSAPAPRSRPAHAQVDDEDDEIEERPW